MTRSERFFLLNDFLVCKVLQLGMISTGVMHVASQVEIV